MRNNDSNFSKVWYNIICKIVLGGNMNKPFNIKELSEADIRTKFITPAIVKAGWNIDTQIREEYPITKGRIIAKGKVCKRDNPLKADYILFYKQNIPLAVVEAKDNNHTMAHGMQQALQYAKMMDIPFVGYLLSAALDCFAYIVFLLLYRRKKYDYWMKNKV